MKKRFVFLAVFIIVCFMFSFAMNAQALKNEGKVPSSADSLFCKLPDGVVTDEAKTTLQALVDGNVISYDLKIFDSEYKALPILVVGDRLYTKWETRFDDYVDRILSSKEKVYLLMDGKKAELYGYKEGDSEGDPVKFSVAYTTLPIVTDALITELRSISEYMVFGDEICRVEQVLPVSNEGGTWAVYYKTDKGIKIKYLEKYESPIWNKYASEVGKGILFTEEEFSQLREEIYGPRVQANKEFFEKYGEYPIGYSLSDLLYAMDNNGKTLNFCEPGNPVPEHLQAELNTLLGVEPPVSTEGPDTDVPTGITTTDITTTDIPTSGNPVSTDDGSVAADREIPWLWIGIGAGALVVVALAIILLTKKKK